VDMTAERRGVPLYHPVYPMSRPFLVSSGHGRGNRASGEGTSTGQAASQDRQGQSFLWRGISRHGLGLVACLRAFWCAMCDVCYHAGCNVKRLLNLCRMFSIEGRASSLVKQIDQERGRALSMTLRNGRPHIRGQGVTMGHGMFRHIGRRVHRER